MINKANEYDKCKNHDRINGNYGNKGSNNDKNSVSTIASALHINSNHIRLRVQENSHHPGFCGFDEIWINLPK
jgi:hypothetical protein